MAKILSFPNQYAGSSEQDFLTDGSHTLSFNTPEDGVVSIGYVPQASLMSLFPDPKKDWSNQELADLFRVQKLLNKANVPVDTDRGVTDEGDPWFVFCHISGEVFIHLCRIDGIYLLDSPNVVRPLRGANFNELIADFTNQTLPAPGTTSDSDRRVIRLERGGKIQLHPSAMLAALIWTLLLASEDLILAAPQDPVEDTDPLLDFEGMFVVENTSRLPKDTMLTDDSIDTANLPKDLNLVDTHLFLESQSQMREATSHHQGLATSQNVFTLGLSTLAIAMGFTSEALLLNNKHKVLESLKELGLSTDGQEAQNTIAMDIAGGKEANAFWAALADFLGTHSSDDTKLANAPDGESIDSFLYQNLINFTDSILTINEAILPVETTTLSVIRDKNSKSEALIEVNSRSFKTTDIQNSNTGAVATTAATSHDKTVLNLSEAIELWQHSQLEEFKLGQITFKASFDMSETAALALVDLIDTTLTDYSAINLSEFEHLTQQIVDYFTDKDKNIGFIEQDNRFIAIDRDAIKDGAVYHIEWQTDDGKLISFIGLQSDFQQFDLIA